MDKNKERKKLRLKFINLQKLLPVLMVLVLAVVPFLGIGKAFAAYNNGYLSNSSNFVMSVGGSVTNAGYANDGSLTTDATLNSSGSSITYTLNQVQNITSFALKAGDTTGYAYVKFYDSSGVQIGSTVTVMNTAMTSYSGSWSNVAKVVLTDNTTATIPIYEFDIYPQGIAHDEITGLSASASGTTATLNYSIPSSNSHFTGSKIYRDGSLIASVGPTVTSYVDSGLSYSTNYTYKVTALYDDGTETPGDSYTLVVGTDPNSLAPNPVSGLKSSNLTNNSVDLSWTPSSSSTAVSYNVYSNGSLIGNTTTSSYSVKNLNGSTTYNLSVTAVTSENVESSPAYVSITTLATPDTTPPDVVSGMSVSAGDGSASVSWVDSTDSGSGIAGYNVYVNGSQVNTGLISNTFYTVPDLTNGTSYDIQVTAVDKSGNESALNTAISVTPKASLVPVIKTSYTLSDVATGVENWFSAYWLIIAFASAIPLSFYIGSRIKLMFLD